MYDDSPDSVDGRTVLYDEWLFSPETADLDWLSVQSVGLRVSRQQAHYTCCTE